MSVVLAPVPITGVPKSVTVAGDPSLLSYIVVANTSLYVIEVVMGSVDKYVLPFSADVIPVDGSTAQLQLNPIALGVNSQAITNQVFLTLYYASDQLNPGLYPQSVSSVAGDALGVPASVVVIGENASPGQGLLYSVGYGTGSQPYLQVQPRVPYAVLVDERSIAAGAGASVDIIAAIGGEGLRLRNIHVCVDTVPGAGLVVVVHFGSSAGASDVGSVSGPLGQAMVPQDLPFGDWTVGQNSLVEAHNVPLFITNAGTAGTIFVRTNVLYSQTNATAYF